MASHSVLQLEVTASPEATRLYQRLGFVECDWAMPLRDLGTQGER